METAAALTLPVACGAIGWVAAFVAIGGGGRARPMGVRLRSAWRLFVHACDRLSRLPLVAMLLRLASWREASDGLASRLVGLRPLMGREQACAALLVAAASASLVCGVLSRSVPGMLVPWLALGVGVPLWAASARRRLARQLAEEMPEVFRALALALSSGETLAQAIDYVGSHGRGPAAKAFARVSMRLRCGDSTREALEALSGELDAPRVGLLVTALLISQRTGSPLRGLLQTSASLAERQGELERLLEVKTAQVRLSARIVCLLPVVLVGLLSMISVDFQKGVATPAGAACVVLALCMDALALFIVRRLMRGVL